MSSLENCARRLAGTAGGCAVARVVSRSGRYVNADLLPRAETLIAQAHARAVARCARIRRARAARTRARVGAGAGGLPVAQSQRLAGTGEAVLPHRGRYLGLDDGVHDAAHELAERVQLGCARLQAQLLRHGAQSHQRREVRAPQHGASLRGRSEFRARHLRGSALQLSRELHQQLRRSERSEQLHARSLRLQPRHLSG